MAGSVAPSGRSVGSISTPSSSDPAPEGPCCKNKKRGTVAHEAQNFINSVNVLFLLPFYSLFFFKNLPHGHFVSLLGSIKKSRDKEKHRFSQKFDREDPAFGAEAPRGGALKNGLQGVRTAGTEGGTQKGGPGSGWASLFLFFQ